MATLTVRNLPEEVHRALRVRAAMHGRSTEAEVRDILEATVCPPSRLRMGTALAELGRRAGLTAEDLAAIESPQDKKPAEPMNFE
ncbi:MAG TPA: plasmid stabilization protein [Verrucomicrobiales bacterium]|nr:plasmid stabilization protein [Verrucomicrobiales bacterium]